MSELKSLTRPCTHLISLNQSSAERKKNVMRLHIAKSRFLKKGATINIATDYDNEVFYDSQRTDSLMMEYFHNLPNENATTCRIN